MLDGVDFGGVHDGLIVWRCHSQVEGGDDTVSYVVFAGYVDAWFEFDMVDGEACDFFHGYWIPFCLCFLIAAEFVIVIGCVFDGFDDEVVAVGFAYFYSDAVADFMADDGFS